MAVALPPADDRRRRRPSGRRVTGEVAQSPAAAPQRLPVASPGEVWSPACVPPFGWLDSGAGGAAARPPSSGDRVMVRFIAGGWCRASPASSDRVGSRMSKTTWPQFCRRVDRGARRDDEIGGRPVGCDRDHVPRRQRCPIQSDRVGEAYHDVVAELIEFEGRCRTDIDDDSSEAGMAAGVDRSDSGIGAGCRVCQHAEASQQGADALRFASAPQASFETRQQLVDIRLIHRLGRKLRAVQQIRVGHT